MASCAPFARSMVPVPAHWPASLVKGLAASVCALAVARQTTRTTVALRNALPAESIRRAMVKSNGLSSGHRAACDTRRPTLSRSIGSADSARRFQANDFPAELADLGGRHRRYHPGGGEYRRARATARQFGGYFTESALWDGRPHQTVERKGRDHVAPSRNGDNMSRHRNETGNAA